MTWLQVVWPNQLAPGFKQPYLLPNQERTSPNKHSNSKIKKKGLTQQKWVTIQC